MERRGGGEGREQICRRNVKGNRRRGVERERERVGGERRRKKMEQIGE